MPLARFANTLTGAKIRSCFPRTPNAFDSNTTASTGLSLSATNSPYVVTRRPKPPAPETQCKHLLDKIDSRHSPPTTLHSSSSSSLHTGINSETTGDNHGTFVIRTQYRQPTSTNGTLGIDFNSGTTPLFRTPLSLLAPQQSPNPTLFAFRHSSAPTTTPTLSNKARFSAPGPNVTSGANGAENSLSTARSRRARSFDVGSHNCRRSSCTRP